MGIGIILQIVLTELPLCSVKIISDRSMGDRNGGSAVPNGIISIYIYFIMWIIREHLLYSLAWPQPQNGGCLN